MSNKLHFAEQVHHNHKNDTFFRKLVKIVIFRVHFLCCLRKGFSCQKISEIQQSAAEWKVSLNY